MFEAWLLLPTASVNLLTATLIEYVASPPGVKVAEYDEPLPERALSEPPLIVMSSLTKLVVLSLAVKVNAIVPSLVVSPLDKHILNQ